MFFTYWYKGATHRSMKGKRNYPSTIPQREYIIPFITICSGIDKHFPSLVIDLALTTNYYRRRSYVFSMFTWLFTHTGNIDLY